jgi:hypothetical protein
VSGAPNLSRAEGGGSRQLAAGSWQGRSNCKFRGLNNSTTEETQKTKAAGSGQGMRTKSVRQFGGSNVRLFGGPEEAGRWQRSKNKLAGGSWQTRSNCECRIANFECRSWRTQELKRLGRRESVRRYPPGRIRTFGCSGGLKKLAGGSGQRGRTSKQQAGGSWQQTEGKGHSAQGRGHSEQFRIADCGFRMSKLADSITQELKRLNGRREEAAGSRQRATKRSLWSFPIPLSRKWADSKGSRDSMDSRCAVGRAEGVGDRP